MLNLKGVRAGEGVWQCSKKEAFINRLLFKMIASEESGPGREVRSGETS